MKVIRADNGLWGVWNKWGLIGSCKTNAEAWRLADSITNECKNRQEDVSDWVNRKNLAKPTSE